MGAEEDKNKFATGIEIEEDKKDSSEEPYEFALNGEIEEKCPAMFTEHRADITYGEYTHGTYYSETCGLERGYSILLPADYNEDSKYPVLYLLHVPAVPGVRTGRTDDVQRPVGDDEAAGERVGAGERPCPVARLHDGDAPCTVRNRTDGIFHAGTSALKE